MDMLFGASKKQENRKRSNPNGSLDLGQEKVNARYTEMRSNGEKDGS